MRLIDADVIKYKHSITTWVDGYTSFESCVKKSEIDNMPTIDAVPVVHGEWIVQTGSYYPRETWIKCSVCNYLTTKSWGETKYCPNCGAKMDGGVENG